MSEADRLLELARVTYRDGNAKYRDAILETGRLLHQFVVAYLVPGDGMGRKERDRLGITREKAIAAAMTALSAGRDRINRLVVASAVADLLGGDGLGGLGWCAIYRFRSFVCRENGRRGHEQKTASKMEAWILRPKFADRAQAMFRQAVAEGWGQEKVHAEVMRVYRGPSAVRNWRKSKAVKEGVEQLQKSARVASPGDVAEMCLAIIDEAAEPYEVALRLRVLLERYSKKRSRVLV